MMDLLEGIMGSGKSYESVVYHVLPALKSGRKVVTNLPLNIEAFAKLDPSYVDLIDIRKAPMPVLGRWDAEAANRGEKCFILGEFDIPEEVKKLGFIPQEFKTFEHDGRPALHAPKGIPLFGHVWDFYDDWRGEGNIGPLYVIDECHVSFPRENIRKKRGTADDVIQWFKLHRHFGADVLLMTQQMRSLEEEIAGLAQFHIRVHKAHFLGKPDEYIRKVFAGFKGGEVQVNERKYKPQYFGLYKSHTQGNTVIETGARDLASTYVKFQRFRKWYAVISIFIIAWALWENFKPKEQKPAQVQRFEKAISQTPPGQTLVDIKGDGTPVIRHPVRENLPVADIPKVIEPSIPDKTEPLEGKTMHLIGWMHMPQKGTIYSVAIAVGSRVFFDTSSQELERAGYKFSPIAECMAMVTWNNKTRPVTCDAPISNSGMQSKPIVISDGQNTKIKADSSASAHVDPDYPHPFTAASKTSRLNSAGSL